MRVRAPMYPYVAPHTSKIHTLITLGIRNRTKPLDLKARMHRPCGFDSHRPLHFSWPGVSLRCPRTRLSLSPSSHSLDAATTGPLMDCVDRPLGSTSLGRDQQDILLIASFTFAQFRTGPPLYLLPYSWERHHQWPVSLRPLGARSSHCHMPQRPSSPAHARPLAQKGWQINSSPKYVLRGPATRTAWLPRSLASV